MSFIFMVFHYPDSSHRDELVVAMREMAADMAHTPGFIEAGAWCEPGTDRVIGISKWASKGAFLATGITFRPSDEVPLGETRPRERFFLEVAGTAREEA